MNLQQKAKNSYDDSGDIWRSFKKSAPGHALLEKPEMFRLLGEVADKEVLCLGCGPGDECDFISRAGARRVVGIDISPKTIEAANETYPQLEFHVMDMHSLQFPSCTFDSIFSSLSFHYAPDWRVPLLECKRVLKPGGELILSAHHPVSWGAVRQEDDVEKSQLLGYRLNKVTGELQLFGDYTTEREVDAVLFQEVPITYHHKSFEVMLRQIRESGLELVDLTEPSPRPEAQSTSLSFWEIRQKLPLFVCFKLRNPAV